MYVLFLRDRARLQRHAVIVRGKLCKGKRPKSHDKSRVLPTAMKADILLSPQKNIARLNNVTEKLHQENLVESGVHILCLPDREEATQSETLVKNENQNVQYLSDVFKELHRRLDPSHSETMLETLRESSKHLEHYFLEFRTSDDLKWQSFAAKAVGSSVR